MLQHSAMFYHLEDFWTVTRNSSKIQVFFICWVDQVEEMSQSVNSIKPDKIINLLEDVDPDIAEQGFYNLQQLLAQPSPNFENKLERILTLVITKSYSVNRLGFLSQTFLKQLWALNIEKSEDIFNTQLSKALDTYIDLLNSADPEPRKNAYENILGVVQAAHPARSQIVVSKLFKPMIEKLKDPKCQEYCLDILAAFSARFGQELGKAISNLTKALLGAMEFEQSILKKKAVAALVQLSPSFTDEFLKTFMDQILPKIQKNGMNASGRLYFQLLVQICPEVGARIRTHSGEIIPVILANIPKFEDGKQPDELQYQALTALETFTQVCSTSELSKYLSQITKLSETVLLYDPVYDTDEEDEEEEEEEEDEEEYEEEEEDDDDDEEDDDDDAGDSSWRSRKNAATIVEMMLRNDHYTIDQFLKTPLPTVLIKKITTEHTNQTLQSILNTTRLMTQMLEEASEDTLAKFDQLGKKMMVSLTKRLKCKDRETRALIIGVLESLCVTLRKNKWATTKKAPANPIPSSIAWGYGLTAATFKLIIKPACQTLKSEKTPIPTLVNALIRLFTTACRSTNLNVLATLTSFVLTTLKPSFTHPDVSVVQRSFEAVGDYISILFFRPVTIPNSSSFLLSILDVCTKAIKPVMDAAAKSVLIYTQGLTVAAYVRTALTPDKNKTKGTVESILKLFDNESYRLPAIRGLGAILTNSTPETLPFTPDQFATVIQGLVLGLRRYTNKTLGASSLLGALSGAPVLYALNNKIDLSELIRATVPILDQRDESLSTLACLVLSVIVSTTKTAEVIPFDLMKSIDSYPSSSKLDEGLHIPLSIPFPCPHSAHVAAPLALSFTVKDGYTNLIRSLCATSKEHANRYSKHFISSINSNFYRTPAQFATAAEAHAYCIQYATDEIKVSVVEDILGFFSLAPLKVSSPAPKSTSPTSTPNGKPSPGPPAQPPAPTGPPVAGPFLAIPKPTHGTHSKTPPLASTHQLHRSASPAPFEQQPSIHKAYYSLLFFGFLSETTDLFDTSTVLGKIVAPRIGDAIRSNVLTGAIGPFVVDGAKCIGKLCIRKPNPTEAIQKMIGDDPRKEMLNMIAIAELLSNTGTDSRINMLERVRVAEETGMIGREETTQLKESALASNLDSLISLFISSLGKGEDEVRSIASESLGRLCHMNPTLIMPKMTDLYKKSTDTVFHRDVVSSFVQAVTINIPQTEAQRQSEQCQLFQSELAKILPTIFTSFQPSTDYLLQEEGLLLVRMVANAYPRLLQTVIRPFVPRILQSTDRDPTRITSNFGGRKVVNEKTERVRFTAFAAISKMAESLPTVFDDVVVEKVIDGVNDADMQDIQFLAFDALCVLSNVHNRTEAIIRMMDKIVTPILTIFKRRVPDNDVNELNNYRISCEACFDVIIALKAHIPHVGTNEFFQQIDAFFQEKSDLHESYIIYQKNHKVD
ncbi:hypothetical protein BLNAU_1689 [Blattamonas nauphoetae]|uniref:TATA-binding protein interacting (TIP20) domain-containing protein n=1 Tax=Blattamonas nauphoetae TaxID=2049346 RepID=A0ABQ9YHK7_9EUKA|nr:hypothetical protein BLNAU_1689 [Blattamonas nauphoetae]